MIFSGCPFIMEAAHGTTDPQAVHPGAEATDRAGARAWREDDGVLAREHGVDHTTIHRWRAQSQAGALEALSGKRGDPDAEAQHRIRELERALGRKTMELEILGEASRRLG